MILPLAIGEGAAAVTFGDRDHAARKSPSDAEAVVTNHEAANCYRRILDAIARRPDDYDPAMVEDFTKLVANLDRDWSPSEPPFSNRTQDIYLSPWVR